MVVLASSLIGTLTLLLKPCQRRQATVNETLSGVSLYIADR
jgi:hypothetical protein